MNSLIEIIALVLIIAYIAVVGVRSYFISVTWTPRTRQGLAYEFGQEFAQREVVSGFFLRFDAPQGMLFKVRPETWFDKLGKFFRIAVERQTANNEFDRDFYLDGEDAEMLRLFQTQVNLPSLIRHLDKALRWHGARLREITWGRGKMCVLIENAGYFSVTMPVESELFREEEALAWLLPLLDIVRLVPDRKLLPKDRARLPHLISVGSWLIGVIAGVIVEKLCSERMVDHFMAWSMQLSLVALGLFLLWVFVRMGPVPSRHRVLLKCLAIGLPGFLCCGILLVRTLDITLAQAPAQRVLVSKARLYKFPMRNAEGPDFRLSFSTDRRDIAYKSPLLLSETEYQRLLPAWPTGTEKHATTLLLHEGALGFAWIEPE